MFVVERHTATYLSFIVLIFTRLPLSGMNGFRAEKMSLRRSSKDWGFMLSETEHTIAAGPFEVLTVDFRSDEGGGFDGHKFIIDMPVESPGELHAVVTWFDAELGRDEQGTLVTLSTSPWASDNSFARQQHWGQNINLLPLSFENSDSGRPLHANADDRIEVTAVVGASSGDGSIYFPSVRVFEPTKPMD